MVCYMYYTDVFVGQYNIDNLNKALVAELGSSELTVELKDLESQLKALAEGLQSFLTGIKVGSYASSYDSSKATWNNLCKNCQCKLYSKSKPCKCPSCGSTSGSPSSSPCSNPSECCADCNVRAAARVFLCFLPCMWYALKFLKEKCEVDWKDQKISDNNHSLRHFLRGMGYDVTNDLKSSVQGSAIPGLLNTLINDSKGSLDKIYNVVKEKYFKFVSPSKSPSQPKTVREILLWLSGLPFTPGFKALLEHCERLCSDIKDSVKFNDFESSLYASCLHSPFVLATIQWPGKSEIFYHNFSEISKFFYPEDPFDLFNMLLEYLRKVFPPLKFLCMQCERKAAEGGWQNCYFGSKCKTTGTFSSPSCCSTADPSSQGYLCTASANPDVHDGHCLNGQCIGSGPCTSDHNKVGGSQGQPCKPCSHPLLRFLLDGSKDLQNFATPFKLPEGFPKMGFSKAHLPSPGKSGNDIKDVLKDFCGSSSLANLFKILTCIFRHPPETLGEFFIFFQKFKNPSVFKKDFADYVTGEPGIYNGQNFTNAFQSALEALKGSSKSHSTSHPFDLFSLHGCHANRGSGTPPTCGKYLYPLIQDASDIFGDDFIQTYLSWICYLPKDFKNRLEEFKGKFSLCCSSGKCQKIVECPCALPFLYSFGFSFYAPNSLNCPGHDEHTPPGQGQNCILKSCKDFLDQLGKVVGKGSPLQKLLNAIDAFLWSIREPFFLFVLAFWAFVISYFLYVQLYKLDLLHLKSHAHFSRSFKILPSTLFSDASSKLKDLSYFTL
ncbi:variant erythrocyte surface antigen-1 family protein [Babesia divergens]|uniref:Variant erythrocyte surface antigen-1 family protein n=1 Tax=Babesia divergens TaxID=32595 RepID=A0AAD9LGA3_BABDI|nr:variant erythrocyte surface antigen-1 family protein [Babesia divergens]